MTKKIYFETLKSILGRSISHYSCPAHLVSYVLSCPTCLVSYVLSCPTCLVPYVFSYFTCLAPYVLSYFTCLVPYVLSCLTFFVLHTPRALCGLVPRVLWAFFPYLPHCIILCLLYVLISPFVLFNFHDTGSNFSVYLLLLIFWGEFQTNIVCQ